MSSITTNNYHIGWMTIVIDNSIIHKVMDGIHIEGMDEHPSTQLFQLHLAVYLLSTF